MVHAYVDGREVTDVEKVYGTTYRFRFIDYDTPAVADGEDIILEYEEDK